MNSMSVEGIRTQLEIYPSVTVNEFDSCLELIKGVLDPQEIVEWAQYGLDLARQTPRSWEVTIEYCRVSKAVLRFLPFESVILWANKGLELTKLSPLLAGAFFRSSPKVIPVVRANYITRWADLGGGLFDGTWRSSNLAVKFFDVSPKIIRHFPPWELERLCALIGSVARRSHDTAMECLTTGSKVFTQMTTEREPFLTLLHSLGDENWSQINGCMKVAGNVPESMDTNTKSHLFRLAERLSQEGHKEIVKFLTTGVTVLQSLESTEQKYVLDLCDVLLETSHRSVPPFIGSLVTVLGQLELHQLEIWFQKGRELLMSNHEAGIAYFKVESVASENVLETLSASVELEKVKGILHLYCNALSGQDMDILDTKEIVGKGIGWVEEHEPTTEGRNVYLPGLVDTYSGKEQNFTRFKVIATHQVSHVEFGSFEFVFDRDGVVFETHRTNWNLNKGRGVQKSQRQLNSVDGVVATDIGRFFNLFPNRVLALDIFTAVEDGRLDRRVVCEYPGLKEDYRFAQTESLKERPGIESLPIQQALVEFIIRITLGESKTIKIPKAYLKEATLIYAILQMVFGGEASVEDSAEATLRIYDILGRLPNEPIPDNGFEVNDFTEVPEFSEDALKDLLDSLQDHSNDVGQMSSEEYDSPDNVDYRGGFKPELSQFLNKMYEEKNDSADQGLSKEMIENLFNSSPEVDLESDSADENDSSEFADNILKEMAIPAEEPASVDGQDRITHINEVGGPLEATGEGTFVYNEWDFRAADYKPKWCVVREKILDDGDNKFYDNVLRNYSKLMGEIRQQFELVVPESFRKIKRLEDGDEIDLDAVIEAAVDRRSGVTPSEKVYWKRNKTERDVAVVFLLDMSASTAEAIDQAKESADDKSAPTDPVEYMMWLRTRRESLSKRNYKRIIDLEKESTALLIQALETIGDTYGIYGFSGYGRENVEFYVIKDIEESFGDKIKRRLEKVSPLHATRMGPAIRHATYKLSTQEARTKILFLISDGRPQDRGYSREGVEKEYAVHDTRMALVEAEHERITPFCLTVDKSGHDYLKAMCGDMGYEVLEDIWALPRRLPLLYRGLTT